MPLTSGWGSTETAPLATTAHFPVDRADVIGLPVPGVEIKLAPMAGKLELRVRGPNVTPGYYKAPDLTREAFDDDGFYRTGDAGRLLDPEAPEKGLVFDGRLAEDFKLGTGTWVHVGVLRTAVLAACAPVLQDLVVCGRGPRPGRHPRVAEPERLPRPGRTRRRRSGFPGSRPGGPRRRSAGSREPTTRTTPALRHGSRASTCMAEPPSIDANEITDKGYVNQRAVLERRADLVARALRRFPGPDVIVSSERS